MATSNSRWMARISIVSLIIFISCVAVIVLFHFRPSWILLLASVSFFIGSIIKFFVLRCQACGVRGGVPQWSKNKTIHCQKCGTPFEYDW